MDTYTFTEAAALLKVSRQTIHRRVKTDPKRYTIETGSGQRQITVQGLEELRSCLNMAISKGIKRTAGNDTGTVQTNTLLSDTLQRELDRIQERNKALQSDVASFITQVTSLQSQLDNANKRISDLESDKRLLAELLIEANKKIPNAAPAQRPGILARLFAGRSERGK
jgi:chromosome segregation ATPase